MCIIKNICIIFCIELTLLFLKLKEFFVRGDIFLFKIIHKIIIILQVFSFFYVTNVGVQSINFEKLYQVTKTNLKPQNRFNNTASISLLAKLLKDFMEIPP